jgi:Tryptophan-associated transmembrane protein (Trp_oprn_chp)
VTARARVPPLVAVLLVVLGGLALAGAGSAEWVRREQVRESGGVVIPEVSVTPGTELAGASLPLGVVASAGGMVLLGRRRWWRRVLAAGLAATGAAGLAAVAAGALAAARLPGSVTSAPAVGAGGALAVLVGGLAVLLDGQVRAPALGPRYSVDPEDVDDAEHAEWRLASQEDDP